MEMLLYVASFIAGLIVTFVKWFLPPELPLWYGVGGLITVVAAFTQEEEEIGVWKTLWVGAVLLVAWPLGVGRVLGQLLKRYLPDKENV